MIKIHSIPEGVVKRVYMGRNLLLSSDVPVNLSDQPVIETESGDAFEVQGDKWGRNLAQKSDILEWGEEGSDEFGSYIEYSNSYLYSKDVLPSTSFEEGVQYTLTFKVRQISGSNPRFGFRYTDGTVQSRYYHNTDFPESYTITSQEGKTIEQVYHTYGTNGRNRVYEFKLEKGTTATPWSPAPEDFFNLKGVEYHLSEPLVKDEWYTLTVQGDFSPDAFVGVWAGDGFVGYLQDGKMTFKLTEDIEVENLIIKSSDEQGIIKSKLEKGNVVVNMME